jgi:transposase InsO family protein
VAHPRARLTPFGRTLLVHRVVEQGWPVAQAADMAGVSRETAYRWLRRYREEGPAGLEDRSSRPKRSPTALGRRDVREILRARRRLKAGPHVLSPHLGRPRSTIYGVLRRHGLSRLAHADRVTAVPIRYCKDRPGELLHVDVKKLGRVPPGGGHRIVGRSTETERYRKKVRPGYDYVHVAVDDHSRVAYAAVFPNERADSCARFVEEAAGFFAELGVRIERVMTDRAKAYMEGEPFQEALRRLGAAHRPTRPYTPRTNGKAERFIRTMVDGWAYARLYRSNSERIAALAGWLHTYNHVRPHTALGGLPPMPTLVNKVHGNHT